MNYNEMKTNKEIELESENIDIDSYFCSKQEFGEKLPILEINEDMNFNYEIKSEYFLNHFINCFNMDINQIKNENTETQSSSVIVNQNKINKKLSGRKRKTEIKEGDIIHDKNSLDNILRKLNCHFINCFIISMINELINGEEKFLKIPYDYIKDVSEIKFIELKQKSIGVIIQQDISKKYSSIDPKHNKNLFDIVGEDENIKNFLNKTYIEVFRKYYFENKKEIKFGDSYIKLKNVETLKEFFLKKNKDNDEDKKRRYERRIYEVIEKKFFTSKIKLKYKGN